MMLRAVILAVLLLAGSATAEEWTVQGTATSRLDYFDEAGDRRLGSYAETGLQAYQELDLALTRESAEGGSWEIDLGGVLSGSAYRTTDPGAQLAYARLRHENAAAPLPYRLDAGDQHARFSRLSLDRYLRGVRLELQPRAGRADHSLVWLSGAYRRHWYDADPDVASGRGEPEGDYHGASWLTVDPRFGRWSLNLVRHDQATADGAERHHRVASVTGARGFRALRQSLDVSAEWAHLEGTEQPDGAPPARDVADQGWYARLAGEDRLLPVPLDYSLEYAHYGAAFEPAGTDVVGDSRTLGATAGLQLGDTRLNGRYNRYVDDASTARALTLDEQGVEILVPFGMGPVTTRHRLDLSRRERDGRAGAVRQQVHRAEWGVTLPLAATAETRMEFLWLDLDDHAGARVDRRDRRASLSYRQRMRLGSVDLTAEPGVSYRERDGVTEQHTVHPTLSLAAAGALHSLDVGLGYRRLRRPGSRTADIDEYRLAMDWLYTLDKHRFGFTYEQRLSESAAGEELDLWRAGVSWRFDFSWREDG